MKGWKNVLFVALSALFVWLFARRVDLAGIAAVWRAIPWTLPPLFMLCVVAQYGLRAQRWGVLLRPFRRGIPFRSLWNFSLIGFMISYLLPGRLGEVARPVLLAEKEDIPKSQALATVVNERLFDLLTVLLMLAAYLAFAGGAPSPLLRRLRLAALLLLPLVGAVFALIALANSPRFSARTAGIVDRLCRLLPARWRGAAAGFALNFIRALRLDLVRRDLAAVAGYSLLHWGLIAFSYWLLLRGFAVAVSPVHAVPLLAVIFVAAAVPTPGMAGSLDLASTYALVGLYAMGEKPAMAFTLLFHFLVLVVPITLGLIALWQEGLSLGVVRRLRRPKDELPAVR
ncbi:MAG TPA: lysylphosphatidylglycerol synthase transmembrane domain-containing protein [Candidatus Aminicenantes bacterium]|nr:lysylphosphatidylglycerol synthase transmembrane domain-containing protein [Candidatus Aminicenantes bacterium]